MKLREKQSQLASLVEKINDNKERCGFMVQHTKNLEAQITSSQTLLDMKKGAVLEETRNAKLTKRQIEKLQIDISNWKKEYAATEEKIRILTLQEQQSQNQIDSFATTRQCTEDQISRWAEEEKKKDEDMLTILRYAHSDNSKIKEFTLGIEKMSQEISSKQKTLEKHETEARTLQIETNIARQQCRTLHQEHQQLIRQCEESLSSIQARSEQTEMLRQELSALEKSIQHNTQLLKEKQAALEKDILSGQHIQSKISVRESQLNKLRLAFGASHQRLQPLRDKIDTLKMTLQATKVAQQTRIEEVQSLKTEITDQMELVAAARAKLDATRNRASQEANCTNSHKQEADNESVLHQQQEDTLNQRIKEIVSAKQEILASSQELSRLKREETHLVSELESTKAQATNLQSRIAQYPLNRDSVDDLDLRAQQITFTLSRVQGKITVEEKTSLTSKVQTLEQELRRESEKLRLISEQQSHLTCNLRKAKRNASQGTIDQEQLAIKLRTMQSEIENEKRLIRQTVQRKERLQAQENTVRSDVNRLSDLLWGHTNDVFTMESLKQHQITEMEAAVRTSNMEAETLKVKLRTLREEKHTRTLELKSRESKVKALQKRYELLIGNMADMDTVEQPTQEFFLQKSEAEKQQLKQEVSTLLTAIQKAEADVTGLEKTIESLSVQNQRLFSANSMSIFSPRDLEEKSTLEMQLDTTSGALNAAKEKLEPLQRQFENMCRQHGCLSSETSQLQQQNGNQEHQITLINADLGELQGQVARAKQMFSRISEDQRKSKKNSIIEKEFEVASIQHHLDEMLLRLSDFAQEHSDLSAYLAGELAAQLQLQLPEPPSSQPQSRPSSGSTAQSIKTSARGRPQSQQHTTTTGINRNNNTASPLHRQNTPQNRQTNTSHRATSTPTPTHSARNNRRS
ncbi:flagellar associated protein [Pelomyxa schiedti]|nr:flagellar associated protein [Pelomyxa schiedti]